jgi:hypothetical protein
MSLSPEIEREKTAKRTSRTPNFLNDWRRKLTTKSGWIGTYSYSWLCTPTLPVYHPEREGVSIRSRRPPPFFALDDELPVLLAIVCGLQHALAMLAGLITPPILFAQALMLNGGTQVSIGIPFY